MLRPATPLTILLFVSFVLLLISVISTPIIKGIPIATYQGYNFGVFGYCQDGGSCSGITIGYTTASLFPGQTTDFNLPSGARHSLSSLLIVHPVAAFCNLIVLCLAVAAHFHAPSHSARYLLALLILLLPTLLITLLAFLVDILIFVPHVRWGGWIVLASTILITASGVVTCAMRRTLVSRKARKKRIAENAEMSGENFYGRQQQDAKIAVAPTIDTESKVPLVNGSPGGDNLPSFTAYDNGRMSEERQYPGRAAQNNGVSPISPVDGDNRYYASSARSNSRPPPGEPGIPLGPINTRTSEGSYRPLPDQRPTGSYPPNAYNARGSYGPPRGRGGYGPRGGFAPRGGFGPRGPPSQGYGRGGFAPDMRGNYGGRGRGGYSGGPMAAGAVGGAMMAGTAGNRGPPPPGYPPQNNSMSPERYGPHQGYSPASQANNSPYTRGPEAAYEPVSPSQYTVGDENATTYAAYGQHPQSPTKTSSLHSRHQSPASKRRSASPTPEMPQIGQAIAMDASGGRGNTYDSDHHGMVDLQRNQGPMASPRRGLSQEYVPPRTQWNDGTNDAPAPAHHAVTMSKASVNRPRGTSNASGSYYEDVDPRFAENADMVSALPPRSLNTQNQTLLHPTYNNHDVSPESGNTPLPHTASYEDLPVGARSPAESETSHFTSVSQRGVNPNWRPGNGGEFNNLGPRRPPQAKQDMLLANNPDFELVPPPARFGGRGGRGGGFRGGLVGGGGISRMPPPSALAINGDSPYPGPTTMREI